MSDTRSTEYEVILVQANIALSVGAPVNHCKKKLLILDINGLLVDIVSSPPEDCKVDVKIGGRAVFRRPFLIDFLKFCFERFEVGIWSSRNRKNVDKVVDFIMGDMKQKLLFCWDNSECTETQFRTLENLHKPLVLKELRKIWGRFEGYFDKSNTLLVDDSPYKALLNPAYTAIFPVSYQFQDRSDNSLGIGGDLRVYLEGFAACGNAQEFVKQNPFGQRPIDERSESWGFYLEVKRSMWDEKKFEETGVPEHQKSGEEVAPDEECKLLAVFDICG